MNDGSIIYDLLQEVRAEQRKQSEELAKQSVWLVSIQKDVSRNTDDLSEHIRRTEILEENLQIQQNKIETVEDRVEKLEWPSKVKEFVFNKYIKWAGAISVTVGIVFTILKIFKIV
jgi:cob(I)alamin adenosyltransferase